MRTTEKEWKVWTSESGTFILSMCMQLFISSSMKQIFLGGKVIMKKITTVERERVNVLDVQGTYRKVTEELWPPTMKIIEQKKTVRMCLNQILGLSTLSDSTVSYHHGDICKL